MKALIFGPQHNRILKKLASIPVPGRISLQYLREPDYFAGVRIQGAQSDVVGVIEDDMAAATVTRSIKKMFVCGEPRDIGYLSGLRVDPSCRNRMHLAHGYKFLRETDSRLGNMPYLCTFISGNRHALETMTGLRTGRKSRTALLSYHCIGHFHTYSLFIPAKTGRGDPDPDIHPGDTLDPQKILSFLREEGSRKQFYPVYTGETWQSCFPQTSWRDFHILLKDDRIMAAAAVVDQSSFKQLRVAGYSGYMKWFRPAINLYLKARGFPRLPPAGNGFRVLSLAGIAARNNDPVLFSRLLAGIIRSMENRGFHFLLAGFCEGDALEKAAKSWMNVRYDSDIHIAQWKHDPAILDKIAENKLCYLELATL